MKTTTEANHTTGLGTLLKEHHRELNDRFGQLVARSREGDPIDLRSAWTSFERELLCHMEIEEAEILPGFARQDAVGARAILAEHAAIRTALLQMGLDLDLHLLRAELVEAFVEQLKAHARQEEGTLYDWAERHAAPGASHSVKTSLKELADAGAGRLAFREGA